MDNVIEKYCKKQGYKLAKKIDDSIAIMLKPKPKYCPKWLYKKIIKDSIEIIEIK